MVYKLTPKQIRNLILQEYRDRLLLQEGTFTQEQAKAVLRNVTYKLYQLKKLLAAKTANYNPASGEDKTPEEMFQLLTAAKTILVQLSQSVMDIDQISDNAKAAAELKAFKDIFMIVVSTAAKYDKSKETNLAHSRDAYVALQSILKYVTAAAAKIPAWVGE
jgi:hypothetical protein